MRLVLLGVAISYQGLSILTNKPNWMSRAHPLFFHIDAVPVVGVGKSWGKSLNVANWGSILAHGSTMEIVFLIWCYWMDTEAKNRTKKTFFEKLKWSFDIVFDGLWPFADHNCTTYPAGSEEARRAGTPLVGSDMDDYPFGVIWQIKADLDAQHKERCAYCQHVVFFPELRAT